MFVKFEFVKFEGILFIFIIVCIFFLFLFLFDWQFVVRIGFILSIDGVEIKGNIVIRKRIDATE